MLELRNVAMDSLMQRWQSYNIWLLSILVHGHNINAKFEHVKGQQDDNLDYQQLLLKAKLNIDTDVLAGLFQKDHRKYLPRVQMLPSCPALLNARGITITSNFRHQLQRAYVEPRYVVHLQDKFGWSKATAEMVA